MKILHSVHPEDFKKYDTGTIRDHFLLASLEQDNSANFIYTHYDRMVAGVVKPTSKGISLDTYENLRSEYFLERREIGIINVAGDGEVVVGEKSYSLQKLDCLYVGRGIKNVEFRSKSAGQPALFFVLSAPAHTSYPTTLMSSQSS